MWMTPIMWTTHTIHLFRMPAFFVLSGFFGALLWKRRGARGTIQNRFERLLLPLVVLSILVIPVMKASFSLSKAYTLGEADVFAPAIETLAEASWLPDLWHLWFLNYLVWIVALTLPVVALFERIWPTRWTAYERLRGVFERPWRTLAVVGVLHTAWWAAFDWWEVPTVGAWIPDPTLLLYYWGCYLLGWMVFLAKPDLSALREHGWRLLWAGIALALGKGVAMLPLLERKWTPELPFPDDLAWTWPIIVGTGAISGVALSMGLAGVFLKVAGEESPRWRGLSDGSYWIYVAHMALVAPVSAVLVGLPVPAPILSIVASAVVFLLCWWSYLALVRSSAIGVFLNGRRYPSPTRLRSLGALVGLGICWVLLGAVFYEPRSPDARDSPWRTASRRPAPGRSHGPGPVHGRAPGLPDVRLDRCIGVDDYILCPDEATWHGAVLACTKLGGALVTLTTEAESTALQGLIAAVTDQAMMVSASDGVEEGRWVWLDGSELDYAPWAPGEPNNYGGPENCAMLNYEAANGWHDYPCDIPLGFVCAQAPASGRSPEVPESAQ